MRLRNKKTGEIGNFCYGYTNELCVSWQKDDGFWAKQEYTSLAELNEEWCDYEEPKTFWYIRCSGEVYEDESDASTEHGEKHKEIGNYFETKEEAELAVRKLKAWKRLKDKGFRFCGGDDACISYKTDIENWSMQDLQDFNTLFGGEE